MELRRYLYIFRDHALLIVVAVVVALAVGWSTAPRSKVYRAQSSVYVGPSTIPVGGANAGDPLTIAQQIVITYTKMIPSRPVAELAVKLTGGVRTAAQAEAETTATAATLTQLITIEVTDPDPVIAATLANAMATAFQTKSATFTTGSGSVPSFPVFPFETATVPTSALSTGLNSRLLTSGLFGLIIGCAAALLLEYVDVTIRGAVDAAARLELPVLGTIPLQSS